VDDVAQVSQQRRGAALYPPKHRGSGLASEADWPIIIAEDYTEAHLLKHLLTESK